MPYIDVKRLGCPLAHETRPDLCISSTELCDLVLFQEAMCRPLLPKEAEKAEESKN